MEEFKLVQLSIEDELRVVMYLFDKTADDAMNILSLEELIFGNFVESIDDFNFFIQNIQVEIQELFEHFRQSDRDVSVLLRKKSDKKTKAPSTSSEDHVKSTTPSESELSVLNSTTNSLRNPIPSTSREAFGKASNSQVFDPDSTLHISSDALAKYFRTHPQFSLLLKTEIPLENKSRIMKVAGLFLFSFKFPTISMQHKKATAAAIASLFPGLGSLEVVTNSFDSHIKNCLAKDRKTQKKEEQSKEEKHRETTTYEGNINERTNESKENEMEAQGTDDDDLVNMRMILQTEEGNTAQSDEYLAKMRSLIDELSDLNVREDALRIRTILALTWEYRIEEFSSSSDFSVMVKYPFFMMDPLMIAVDFGHRFPNRKPFYNKFSAYLRAGGFLYEGKTKSEMPAKDYSMDVRRFCCLVHCLRNSKRPKQKYPDLQSLVERVIRFGKPSALINLKDPRPVLFINGTSKKSHDEFFIACENQNILLPSGLCFIEAFEYLIEAFYIYNFKFPNELAWFFIFIMNNIFEIPYEVKEYRKIMKTVRASHLCTAVESFVFPRPTNQPETNV